MVYLFPPPSPSPTKRDMHPAVCSRLMGVHEVRVILAARFVRLSCACPMKGDICVFLKMELFSCVFPLKAIQKGGHSFERPPYAKQGSLSHMAPRREEADALPKVPCWKAADPQNRFIPKTLKLIPYPSQQGPCPQPGIFRRKDFS